MLLVRAATPTLKILADGGAPGDFPNGGRGATGLRGLRDRRSLGSNLRWLKGREPRTPERLPASPCPPVNLDEVSQWRPTDLTAKEPTRARQAC